MTENTTTHAPLDPPKNVPGYFQTPPPAPTKKPWFKKPAALIPIGTLLLGLALGSANTPEPVTVEVPGPERIVEKDKRVEVKVPVTPAVCIEALDLAGAGIALLAEIPEHASDAVMAAGAGDSATLSAVTRKMEALNTKISAAAGPLGVAAQSCRASAE